MDRQSTAEMLRTLARGAGMSLHELASLADDLATTGEDVPTVADFYPRVEEVDSGKAGWVNRHGQMRLIVEVWGDRRLDQVRPGDVEAVAVARRNQVVAREDERQAALAERGMAGAPKRSGRGAEANFIAAARRFFQIAVEDRLLAVNPARSVPMPRRAQPSSRSLTPPQLESLWSVVVSGGNDPALDGLLVWTHLETGARRGGLLDLYVRDLKQEQCAIELHEKGKHGKEDRVLPISRELMTALLAHARERGPGGPNDKVFYYRDSTPERPHPLAKKRYETLVARIRTELPWARDRWMKLHDLRRTGITAIERVSGSPAIARLFAGHTTGTALDTYDKADEEELRAAMAEYLGRPVGTDASPQ